MYCDPCSVLMYSRYVFIEWIRVTEIWELKKKGLCCRVNWDSDPLFCIFRLLLVTKHINFACYEIFVAHGQKKQLLKNNKFSTDSLKVEMQLDFSEDDL